MKEKIANKDQDKGFDIWSKWGMTQKDASVCLGPYSSYQWRNSRRHLLFTAARYKFAMKMIGNMYEPEKRKILDLGCNDGFGTYYAAEYAQSVLAVDFDEDAIAYAKENSCDSIEFRLENFLDKYYGEYDAVVSFDVLEHIYPEDEEKYMNTVLKNLKDSGTFVVGTPSLESQQYSKENVSNAHVNVYKGEDFYCMLRRYFHNVYLFTQNDEIIHTGHLRMANYLIAVCANKKQRSATEDSLKNGGGYFGLSYILILSHSGIHKRDNNRRVTIKQNMQLQRKAAA